MRLFCTMNDEIARKAVNIAQELEKVGVGRVYARKVAVEWLAFKCNTPLLITHEIYSCLREYHKLCSQGNKICDLAPDCSKFRDYPTRPKQVT